MFKKENNWCFVLSDEPASIPIIFESIQCNQGCSSTAQQPVDYIHFGSQGEPLSQWSLLQVKPDSSQLRTTSYMANWAKAANSPYVFGVAFKRRPYVTHCSFKLRWGVPPPTIEPLYIVHTYCSWFAARQLNVTLLLQCQLAMLQCCFDYQTSMSLTSSVSWRDDQSR